MTLPEVSPATTTTAARRGGAAQRVGAARRAGSAQPLGARPAWIRRDRLVVAGFVVLAVILRAPNLGRSYWVDEGISVGIASHPLSRLPGLLRHDGSPPLFYALLHFWIRLFGTSEPATHLLPLLLSLAAVPVGYWAGSRLFGRTPGLATAGLVATNPFLNWYSTETRMYTLVVLLSLLGVTLAWTAFQRRTAVDAAGAVAAFAALLYTHDWGIYLAAATGLVLVRLAWRAGDQRLARQVVAAGAAVVLLWLPWLPTFLFQAGNTAAPWAVRPGIGDLFADPSTALAGTLGFCVVPVAALAAWRYRDRAEPVQRRAAAGIFAIAAVATVAGFVGAQLEPSWTVRYLAVIVAPFLLAAAGLLGASRHGRRVLAGLGAALAAWSIVGVVLPNPNATYAKSNVAAVVTSVAPRLQPGDVVVVNQTEQTAVADHYLPAGLTYLNPTGPVRDPSVVDWRDIVDRLQAASPCRDVAPTVDALPVGADILEINPARVLGATGSAWSKASNGDVRADQELLARDPALVPVGLYTSGLQPRPFSPVDGVLYRKISTATACGAG